MCGFSTLGASQPLQAIIASIKSAMSLALNVSLHILARAVAFHPERLLYLIVEMPTIPMAISLL